jgi:hypothetical protein
MVTSLMQSVGFAMLITYLLKEQKKFISQASDYCLAQIPMPVSNTKQLSTFKQVT